MPSTPPISALADFPLNKADLCVKCGLCLPHCPTYQLTQNEAESPRGRIALLQGLATAQLPVSPALEAHLDHCLGCRSCESVCPAQVPYGELIDAGRASLQGLRPRRNRLLRWLAPWLLQARRRHGLNRLLRIYQRLGLQAIARSILPGNSRLARAAALLPPISPIPSAGLYPSIGVTRGRLQLFTGCVGELVDGAVLQDSIYLLQRCGFEVDIPTAQTCCGALHLHNGMSSEAQQLFRQNLKAFADQEGDIIGTATGCTAMLHEYSIYLPGQVTQAMVERVSDINAFLVRHWPSDLKLTPLQAVAVVQDPCSLRNVLGGANAIYRLLEGIPELQVTPLPVNSACCGAAGSMMFTEPTQADALAAPKLAAIKSMRPDYLVSSNVGCAMHLAGNLRRAGLATEVIHPVSLLARQLRLAG